MRDIISSQLFLLSFTIGIYLLSMWLYAKTKIRILNPLLISICVIILFLKLAQIEYSQYKSSTQIIDFMLGMSVVALGYLLYEQIEHIKGRFLTIITAVSVGSFISIVSVVLIARYMGATPAIIASLGPKSVTTPIAISLSENSGGIASLTSIVVIIVGIFGNIAGPFILDKLGIENKIARGLALGSAAHAVGTARAIELGAIEGAISGLAIGVMGIITALMIPVLQWIL